MAKTIQTVVKTTAQQEANQPIYLVTMTLDNNTYYFTDNNENVIFPTGGGGNTYTGWGMDFSPIKTNISFEVDRVRFSFDNTDLTFSNTYMADDDFYGRTLKLSKVFYSQLASDTYEIILFQGEMKIESVNEHAVTIIAVSPLNKLRRPLPGRIYQNNCPYVFDSAECLAGKSYTNTTISFVASGGVVDGDYINDSDSGFVDEGFAAGQKVTVVSDSGTNDGTYTITSVTTSKIYVEGTWVFTTESAVSAGSVVLTKSIAEETTGIATAGSSASQLVDTSRTEADDYWNEGVLTMTSGANNGISRKIKDFVASSDTATFYINFPNAISIGDTYTIKRGCYKTSKDCKLKHDNYANFGGFVALPMPPIEELR